MADETEKPQPPASSGESSPATPATPSASAADKTPSAAPAEPLKAEPSRAPSPAAGASAVAPAAAGKPATPAAPRPAAPAAGAAKPAAAAGAAKPAPHAAAPAAPAGPPDPAPPETIEIPAFLKQLQAAFAGSAIAVSYWVGDFTVVVPRERILDVLTHLRDAPEAAFDMLSDLTATDWPPRTAERFDIIYCLWSTRHRQRLRVKTKVGDDPLPSATAVWPAANWLEREVFDMFGVNFTGHPDRRRILMPDDWQGHPQRKDYPLEGPGELLLENPVDWLKVRQAASEADIE